MFDDLNNVFNLVLADGDANTWKTFKRSLDISQRNSNFKGYYASENDAGDLILEIDLPGVEKSDVDLSVVDDFIELKAVRKSKNLTYKLKLQIDKKYDLSTGVASMVSGVLTYVIKKKQSTTNRKVSIL